MPEAVQLALVALGGGIITAALGLVPAWLRRRTDKAEAADYISAAWEKLNEAAIARLDALETKYALQTGELERVQRTIRDNAALHAATVEALRNELDLERRKRESLERWVELLVKQLEENGITPVPRPT